MNFKKGQVVKLLNTLYGAVDGDVRSWLKEHFTDEQLGIKPERTFKVGDRLKSYHYDLRIIRHSENFMLMDKEYDIWHKSGEFIFKCKDITSITEAELAQFDADFAKNCVKVEG